MDDDDDCDDAPNERKRDALYVLCRPSIIFYIQKKIAESALNSCTHTHTQRTHTHTETLPSNAGQREIL